MQHIMCMQTTVRNNPEETAHGRDCQPVLVNSRLRKKMRHLLKLDFSKGFQAPTKYIPGWGGNSSPRNNTRWVKICCKKSYYKWQKAESQTESGIIPLSVKVLETYPSGRNAWNQWKESGSCVLVKGVRLLLTERAPSPRAAALFPCWTEGGSSRAL